MENTNQMLAAITTDMSVTITDLVAAMVSRWENNLFTLKDELSQQINQINKDIDLVAGLVILAGKELFEPYSKVVIPAGLPMTFKADAPTVKWPTGDTLGKVVVHFVVTIRKEENQYRDSSSGKMEFDIPAEHLTNYDGLVKQRDELTQRLSTVLVEIKSVSRKERQLRGQLLEQKFHDQGFADLIQRPEFANLLTVKI